MNASIVLLLVSSLSQAPSQALPQTPEAEARAIIGELVAGQFDRIEARYDEAMLKALPPGTLGTSWTRAATQLGAFVSIDDVKTQSIAGHQVVLVTCTFQKTTIGLRVVLDDQHRLAGFASVPAPSRDVWTTPPYVTPASFTERSITVRTGHWELPGIVTLPSTAGPHPAVVLVPGSGPNDMDESLGPNKIFKDLADGLATRGVAVLRFEKRTHKYGAQSSDDPARFTMNDEEGDDARSAVALLAGMPEINPRRIFVAGHSEGGYLAPRIATGDAQIAGIILLAGNVRPLADLIVEQVRYEASLGGAVTPAGQKAIDAAEASAAELRNPDLKPGMTVHVLGAALPASYVLDMRAYHPTETAAALTIPILILQGERDYQVTMTDFSLWRQALGSHTNVTFKSYPALDHLFLAGSGPSTPAEYEKVGHVDATVIGDIAVWVQAHR